MQLIDSYIYYFIVTLTAASNCFQRSHSCKPLVGPRSCIRCAIEHNSTKILQTKIQKELYLDPEMGVVVASCFAGRVHSYASRMAFKQQNTVVLPLERHMRVLLHSPFQRQTGENTHPLRHQHTIKSRRMEFSREASELAKPYRRESPPPCPYARCPQIVTVGTSNILAGWRRDTQRIGSGSFQCFTGAHHAIYTCSHIYSPRHYNTRIYNDKVQVPKGTGKVKPWRTTANQNALPDDCDV